ncbi:MFS transporter [Streptomyces kanasensis]|uniref:MFS transporter n=1 Tax=Streptomyces kanasensis TaxID=936756 RepID=UPI0038307513
MGGITLAQDEQTVRTAAPGATAPPPSPDGPPHHPDPALPPVPGPRRAGLALTGLALAVLLAALQQLALAAVLPAVTADLPGRPDRATWAVTAFLLTATASLPLHGKLGDLYGRKAVFQGALTLFVAASALAGWARTPDELVALRAVQGLGAGGVLTGAQALAADLAPARRRGRHLGVLAAVFTVATVTGPLLGGYVTETASWRWTFHLAVPGGLAALAVVGAALRPSTPAGRGRGSAAAHRRARPDVLGALLLTAATACLVLLLTWGGTAHAWTSRTILGLACAAAGSALLHLVVAHRAPEPVIPLRLLRDPVFLVCAVVGAVVGVALLGVAVCLPALLRQDGARGALDTWLLILPLLGALAAASLVSGHLVSRTGHYAVHAVIGTAVAAVGMWLLSQLDADTPRLDHSVWQAVLGTGIGLVLPVLVLAVQNAARPGDVGAATGALTLCQQIGASAGVTLLGTLFAGPRPLPPVLRHGYAHVYADAAPRILLHLVPVLAVGLFVAFFLKERPLVSDPRPAAGAVPAARGPRPVPPPGPTPAYAGPEPTGATPADAVPTGVATPADAVPPHAMPVDAAPLDAGPAASRAAVPLAGAAAPPPPEAAYGPASLPAPGAPVCGTVRHHDGSPVPGAALTLIDVRGRQTGRGASGADGRYALSTPAPGAYVLIASAAGHQPRAVTLTAGDRPDGAVELDVVLGGAGRLSGVVTTPDGSPVQDAGVTLTDVRGDVVATARTASDGGYLLTELIAGEYTLASGAPGLRPTAVPVTVQAARETRQDVELAGGAVLCGTVRAPGGRPVEDARVTLLDAAGNVVDTLTTGPDGIFRFVDVPSGAHTVIATGYPPVATALSVTGGGRTERDVLLGHDA